MDLWILDARAQHWERGDCLPSAPAEFSQSLLDQGVRERQGCSTQGGLQMEQEDLEDMEE
jgi:hypothetical protein